MNLECIVTLANKPVEVLFRACERSLRSVGCTLPIKVIPYDDQRFTLPDNATWWEMPEITNWLTISQAHPMMRKYQCLTIGNYQFVDTDVIFLRDPSKILSEHHGFVVCCGHWRDTSHATTPSLVSYLSKKSTNWQKTIFNAGQFACELPLYTVDSLIQTASASENRETCLTFPHHDQPGLNMLVNLSGVTITNITLPPHNVESSWAGDYTSNYRSKWDSFEHMPYLIHWAGRPINGDYDIDKLFLDYLTADERKILLMNSKETGCRSLKSTLLSLRSKLF